MQNFLKDTSNNIAFKYFSSKIPLLSNALFRVVKPLLDPDWFLPLKWVSPTKIPNSRQVIVNLYFVSNFHTEH